MYTHTSSILKILKTTMLEMLCAILFQPCLFVTTKVFWGMTPC